VVRHAADPAANGAETKAELPQASEPDAPEPEAPAADESDVDRPGRWGRIQDWAAGRQNALAAAVVYLAGSLIVTRHLWPHPGSLLNAANAGDQMKFEWVLGEAARSLLHPHTPLFSSTMGVGALNGGTNLIANTSILFFGYLFSPITLLFGAGLSYLLIIAGNIVATAVAWRWFFRAHVTTSEPAAFVGGLFLGFSPSMMSHSLGHPNLTAQWLIPIMLHIILSLHRSEHRVRDGVILGVLVFAQFFIAEEPLFLLGISLIVFLLGCAIFSPSLVRMHWRGMAIGGLAALGTCVVLLGYPLYFQFAGPLSSVGVPFSVPYFSQDLAGYLQFPNQSLGGNLTDAVFAPGATEQAALFGGPLVVLLLLACIAFVDRIAVRASALCVLVLVALSLGPSVHVGNNPSTLPALWAGLQNLPLFEDSLPVRMAMALTPFAGYLLVIVIEQATRVPRAAWRLPCYAIIVAVLIPLTPRPIVAQAAEPTSLFFTLGDYKNCISGGRSLVTVPSEDWTPLLWTASLTDEVPLAQSPFVYPDGAPDKKAVFGSSGRELFAVLGQVASTGANVPVTDQLRTAVNSDLRYWSAGCVLLIHSATKYSALKTELDSFLRQATVYDNVDVWSVHS
jgi:hypothetical protein